jgi:hypothetical protein
MDKFLYLAMNGASQSMLAQTTNANNLANASTVGFKATLDHFQAKPVYGPGHADRAYSTNMGKGGLQYRLRMVTKPIHEEATSILTRMDYFLMVRIKLYLAMVAPLLFQNLNHSSSGEMAPSAFEVQDKVRVHWLRSIESS